MSFDNVPPLATNTGTGHRLKRLRCAGAILAARRRRHQITQLLLYRNKGPCCTDDAEAWFDEIAVQLVLSCSPRGVELAAREWAARFTPKLSSSYIGHAIEQARRAPPAYNSIAIGLRLSLTLYEYDHLRLTHLAPKDLSPREIASRRKSRTAERRKASRLASGETETPRDLALTRTRPWLELGYRCRRTWERHGKPMPAEVGRSGSEPPDVAGLSCVPYG